MRLITNALWHFLVCAAAVALIGPAARATPETTVPTGLEMSMDANTFVQGEPIVLHYKIINGSDQEMYPDIRDGRNQCLEENYKGWFSLTLKDTKGTTAPSVSSLPPVSGGAYSIGPRIPIGSSYADSLIVNQWIVADHPGSYTLSVHVRLPCTLGRGASMSWFPLTEDFSFPVIITPADSNRLRLKASTLRAGWMAGSDRSQRALPLKSLFALPEQVGLPEWQALVTDDSLTDNDRQQAAEEIAQIKSLAAVDLLAHLCWGQQQRPRPGVPMMVYLSSMWTHGDAVMKKRIEELAAEHGEAMPFKPLVRLD